MSERDSGLSIARGFHALVFNTCGIIIMHREGFTSELACIELASRGQINMSTLKQEHKAYSNSKTKWKKKNDV